MLRDADARNTMLPYRRRMQLPSAIVRTRALASVVLFAVAAASLSACASNSDPVVIDGSLKASELAEQYAVDALIGLRKATRTALNSHGIDGVAALASTRWDDRFTSQDVQTFAPSRESLGTVYDFAVDGESFTALGAALVEAGSKGVIDLSAARSQIVVCFGMSGSYDGVDFSEAPCPDIVDSWAGDGHVPREVISVAALDLPLEDRSFIPRTPLPSPSSRPGACSGTDCPGG